MADQDSLYAAAKRLVRNMYMYGDGCSKGMLMRMLGCDHATMISIMARLEREEVFEAGWWDGLPSEFGWEPLNARVFKLKPEYETCPRCGGALVEATPLGSNTTKRFCPSCDRPTTSLDAQVLGELKAIRALLERQTAVLAWHSGLQRSPFSPSPVDPEQAAEEARSAALARQQAGPAASGWNESSPLDSAQSSRSAHGCSGCSE